MQDDNNDYITPIPELATYSGQFGQFGLDFPNNTGEFDHPVHDSKVCQESVDIEEWSPPNGLLEFYNLDPQPRITYIDNIKSYSYVIERIRNETELSISLIGPGLPHRRQITEALVLANRSNIFVLKPRKELKKLLPKILDDGSIIKYTSMLPYISDALQHKWDVTLPDEVEDASVRHYLLYQQYKTMSKTQQANFINFPQVKYFTESYDNLVHRYLKISNIYFDEDQLHHLRCRPLCKTAINIIKKQSILIIPLVKQIRSESERELLNIIRVFRDYLRVMPESYAFFYSKHAIDYSDLHAHITYGPIFKVDRAINDEAYDSSDSLSSSTDSDSTSDSAIASSSQGVDRPREVDATSFMPIEFLAHDDTKKSRVIYDFLRNQGEVGITMLAPRLVSRFLRIKMIALSSANKIFALELGEHGHPLLTVVARCKFITKYTVNLMHMSECLYDHYKILLQEPIFDAQAMHTHICLETKCLGKFKQCCTTQLFGQELSLQTYEDLVGSYVDQETASFANSMLPEFKPREAEARLKFIDTELKFLDDRPFSDRARLLVFKRAAFVVPLCKSMLQAYHRPLQELTNQAKSALSPLADGSLKMALDNQLDSFSMKSRK